MLVSVTYLLGNQSTDPFRIGRCHTSKYAGNRTWVTHAAMHEASLAKQVVNVAAITTGEVPPRDPFIRVRGRAQRWDTVCLSRVQLGGLTQRFGLTPQAATDHIIWVVIKDAQGHLCLMPSEDECYVGSFATDYAAWTQQTQSQPPCDTFSWQTGPGHFIRLPADPRSVAIPDSFRKFLDGGPMTVQMTALPDGSPSLIFSSGGVSLQYALLPIDTLPRRILD